MSKGKNWSQKELYILEDFYLKESDLELMKRLKGRSKTAISHKRSELGLLRREYNNPLLTIIKHQHIGGFI